MNNQKFAKPAKLPKGAYQKDLGSVTSKYATQGKIRAISDRMQKSGWRYSQEDYGYELVNNGEVLYKLEESEMVATTEQELVNLLTEIYRKIGWTDEHIKNELTYILTGEKAAPF